MFDELKQQLREDPVDSLTRGQLNDRFAEVRRLKGAVAVYEARLVRAIDGLDDRGLDGQGTLRAQGKVSDRAAARTAATAKRLPELPKVEAALEEGRITAEHADAMADAAEKVSPEEAEDELLDDGEVAPADVFAKRSREWSSKKTNDDGTATHERQRRDRAGRRWIDENNGMVMFLFGLDREAGDAATKALNEREQQLWRDDGGREGHPADMRTAEQRMADAFVELLTGPRASGSSAPPHPKHQVNAVFDLNGMTDDDGRPLASLVVDGRPLPAAVLERIGCTAGITPMVFNGPGRPIWVGRDHRSATVAQWRALIARDRGCVGCGADASRCEAHHILPWWERGDTDIDNLVLVCSRCHHDLHDRGMVLRRSGGRWHIVNRDGPAPVPDRGDDLWLIA
ncbi:MAG: DUF222 domain-containing protein [Acidimicrobiales bacterium]